MLNRRTPPIEISQSEAKRNTFLPDQPSDIDHLDFSTYINALVDLVTSPETRTPLTLGIFGSWGSGKTTLMQLMEKEINRRYSNDRSKKLKTLWVNVWQISQQGKGWDAFLQSLFTRVHKKLSFIRRIAFDIRLLWERVDTSVLLRQLLINSYRIVIVLIPILVARLLPANNDAAVAFARDPRIVNITTILLGAWLLLKPIAEAAKEKVSLDLGAVLKKAPYEDQISALEQLQDQFERLVKAWVGKEGRLVIFIDDLDRCSPDKIAEVLEALKLFATTGRCIYVLGVDEQVVARSVQAKYKDIVGAPNDGIPLQGVRYLEKIIQLPFLLPIIEIDDIQGYVKSFNADWPHPGCMDIFAKGLPPNPRQVKRAVNVFFLLWQLAENRRKKLGGTLTALRLAKVVALQTIYPEIFEVLKDFPQLLQQAEDHCLKTPDEQSKIEEGNLLSRPLQNIVAQQWVKRLLLLHRDNPLALFAKLSLEDLTAFFSLARRVPGVDSGLAEATGTQGAGTIKQDSDKVIKAPVLAISSLHQLPPPPRDFIGRTNEINEIINGFEQGKVKAVALQGIGGIGKTSLALKLGELLTPLYPDAQFYVDLKGASTNQLSSIDALTYVIRAYYPDAKLPESEAELNSLYRSVLKDQRALLLLDNAGSAEQIEPLIPPTNCALLITSRKHFALPGVLYQNLDVFSPDAARALLLSIAPRIQDQADTIAELCGYLPLALRLAASALAEHIDISPEDYVRRLMKAQQRLELVDASFRLSYELLTPEMQKLWRRLTALHETFDVTAAAAIWAIDSDAAQQALSRLVAESLLEWNATTARYRLNDLARLFASSHISAVDLQSSQLRLSTYFLEVLRRADNLYREGGDALKQGLSLFDSDWGNIKVGQAYAAEHFNEDERAAALCSSYPAVGAYLLDLRQPPLERISWLEIALSASRRINDKPMQGSHLGNLGLTYAALGETKRAIDCLEKSLIILREIADRHGEGSVLSNLGMMYAQIGESRRALDFFDEALTILREIGDRLGESNTLGNLGSVYYDLGDTQRAIEIYEQRLAVTRELGDRRGEGNTLGNLGSAYLALGEMHRAISLYEQQLTIARELGYVRNEGAVLGNLGLVYSKLGDVQRAARFLEQSLLVLRTIGDRSAEGAVLGNLGLIQAELGDAQRAIELFEEQLTIAREIGDRRREASALFNMSLVLDKMGNRDQAVAQAESALSVFEQLEDPNAIKVREQLAQWQGS